MPTQNLDDVRTPPVSTRSPDLAKLAQHHAAIIEEIRGDLNSEGMRETPIRAAKAIVEITEGARLLQKDENRRSELFLRPGRRG